MIIIIIINVIFHIYYIKKIYGIFNNIVQPFLVIFIQNSILDQRYPNVLIETTLFHRFYQTFYSDLKKKKVFSKCIF